MPDPRLKILGAAVLFGTGLIASPAHAQAIDDTYWISGSGFLANVDTDVSSSTVVNPGGGTEIDLEDDVGLDNDALLPAIYAGAKLGGGFVITGEYYSLGRDTTGTISRNITIDDVTYPVNGSLTVGFDTDIYRFTVGYSFIRNETTEIGAAIGLHATDLQFSVSGQGSAGGAPVSIQSRRKDFLAPMPTVGLYGTFEIVPQVTLNARADYLSLGIGDYDGSVLNAQASVAYRFTDNFGIGVGYRYVDYDLDVDKDTYVASFDYRFWGPSVFLELGF
ncbi:MAG TPA: hypothetical protein VFS49_10640 [Croceibacterium sp.]|nr:hypothetical protein [Croceibacterium sp.]